MGFSPLVLLLFLPLAEATCQTTLPTDASFAMAAQYHAGEYGTASSVHLLSFANQTTYSLAYNLVSGTFLKQPSTQCPQTCLTRLRAMGKPGKEEGSTSSIIMMWDAAGQSPPATNILYSAYTTTVVPGEYLYCSNVAGTCGASVPLYLYYNAETDDYQVRGDKDTVDDAGAKLQNMGLPICWMFPPLATTSTSTSTATGSSTTTSFVSSTSTVSGPSTTTTNPSSTMVVIGGSTTTVSSSTGTGSTTTTSSVAVTGSSTATTPYTGPVTYSTTADPAASTTTTASSSSSTGTGTFSTTTTSKPTTTTSPYVYGATTDISGTYGPGDQKLENGTVIRPNGDTIYPNGTVRTSDGAVIEGGKKTDPDGTVHNPDGSTKYPNGTVTYPGDSTSGAGGGDKSDDDTPSWIIPVIIVCTILIGLGALGMIVFGVTSMMKAAPPPSTVNPYDVPNTNEQWPNQRQPTPNAELPPPVYDPVMTAQPQSFGTTQTLHAGPNPLYFG